MSHRSGQSPLHSLIIPVNYNESLMYDVDDTVLNK